MKENKNSLEFHIHVQVLNPITGEIVSSVESCMVLEKDKEIPTGATVEDWITFNIEPGEQTGDERVPKIVANYHSKLSPLEPLKKPSYGVN